MPFFGRGRGGGGGFNARWIIGLVIAGVGLLSYLASTQINPVTGEKQRVALSVDQEKALGLESAPQMIQQMGARPLDPGRDARAALVQEVGRKLVQSSRAAESPYAQNFSFTLLDDETVNAFALPGGPIFITTALFDQLENEAQLAGVLGHEIGHVIHRHSAEHMAKQRLGQTVVGGVAVGASGEDGRGQMAAVAAAMANQMLQLRYGRQDESESDKTGIEYMVSAGYDPRGMLGVMEVLKKASGGRGGTPEFMQSHPLPETRLQQIAQLIEQNFTREQLARLTEGRPLRGADARLAGERQDGLADPAPRQRDSDEERW
jgi:predicted Zn-dependent protease